MAKRLRNAVTASLLLAAASCAHAQDAIPPRLGLARAVAAAPRIDGTLDDPCWAGLAVLDRFGCVMTKSGPPDAAIGARAGYDARHLYIGVRCDEPRMDQALALANSGDPYNEAVELFIDGNRDRHTYSQFRVAITGAAEHRRGMEPVETTWPAAVARDARGWSAEIAVPWSLLGVTPERGAAVGLNVNRIRMNPVPGELVCWAPTPESFHAPAKFGDLVLGSYAAWLDRLSGERVAGIRQRTLAMLERFPVSTRELRNRVHAWAEQTRPGAAAASGVDTERAAMAALTAVTTSLQRAEETYRTVRLAVIAGEFR